MEPNELRKLRKEWYYRLQQEGFKDIETEEGFLKSWTIDKVNRRLYRGHNKKDVLGFTEYSATESVSRFSDIQNYYRLCGFFLHDYNFTDEVQKLIWEMHCENISYRKISKNLKALGIKKGNTAVLVVIHALKKKMMEMYAVTDGK